MWLFMDSETSGLTPRFGADIVEVAVVDENEKVRLESLARPKKPIPKSATAVHGIKNEYVQSAKSSDDVRSYVYQLCRNQNVAIFNAQFDLRFFPDLPLIANCVCLMKLVSTTLGLHNPSLSKTAEILGIEWPEGMTAHRALADAVMTARIFRALAVNPEPSSLKVNGRPLDRFRGKTYFSFRDVPECLQTRTGLKRRGLQPGGVTVATVQIGEGQRIRAGSYNLFSLDEAKPLPGN